MTVCEKKRVLKSGSGRGGYPPSENSEMPLFPPPHRKCEILCFQWLKSVMFKCVKVSLNTIMLLPDFNTEKKKGNVEIKNE